MSFPFSIFVMLFLPNGLSLLVFTLDFPLLWSFVFCAHSLFICDGLSFLVVVLQFHHWWSFIFNVPLALAFFICSFIIHWCYSPLGTPLMPFFIILLFCNSNVNGPSFFLCWFVILLTPLFLSLLLCSSIICFISFSTIFYNYIVNIFLCALVFFVVLVFIIHFQFYIVVIMLSSLFFYVLQFVGFILCLSKKLYFYVYFHVLCCKFC